VAAEYLPNNSLNARSSFEYDRYGNRYRPQQNTANYNVGFVPVEHSDISAASNRYTRDVAYDPAGNIKVDMMFRQQQYDYDANNRLLLTRDGDGRGISTAARPTRISSTRRRPRGHRVATASSQMRWEYFAAWFLPNWTLQCKNYHAVLL